MDIERGIRCLAWATLEPGARGSPIARALCDARQTNEREQAETVVARAIDDRFEKWTGLERLPSRGRPVVDAHRQPGQSMFGRQRLALGFGAIALTGIRLLSGYGECIAESAQERMQRVRVRFSPRESRVALRRVA